MFFQILFVRLLNLELNCWEMQNPNEDTEWNDVLRQKGILPPKEPSITEDQIAQMLEEAAEKHMNKSVNEDGSVNKPMDEMDLDELEGIEDDVTEDDERAFEEYRRKRMAELKVG